MRKLFMPACICLMTFSGPTNSDLKLSLDEFSGASTIDKNAVARAEPAETAAGDADAVPVADPVQVAIPAQIGIPSDVAPAEIAADAPAPMPEVIAAEPERIPLPPIAKPVVQRSHREICDTLTEAAQDNDLPIPFFIRLLFQESRFEAGIVSSAGAQGIAQFMPETAADMGVKNPFDPLQAIPASARLLRNLIAQFGNLGLAAAAYNAGPKRIQDWLETKGKGKLPEETQGYVKTITGHAVENWTAAKATHPGQKLPRRAPCQEAAGVYAWNGPGPAPLPKPSPQPHRTAPPAHRTAVAAAQAKVKTAHGATRVTAVITVAKTATTPPAAKAASQQLAARRHKPGKPKLEKLAQR